MIGLPLRSLVRYHRDRPWLFLLSVTGVALGVSVIVATALAIQSARASFADSAETVAGRTTHEIVPVAGALDETLFTRIRVEGGVRQSAPLVEGEVVLREAPGRVFTLLGVDPLSEQGIRPFVSAAEGQGTIGAAGSAGILLAASLAGELRLERGDSVHLQSGTGLKRFGIAGTFADGDATASGLLVADISVVQPFLGMEGLLSRIDLRIPDAGSSDLESLRRLLPPDVELNESGVRSAQIQRLTRAFELNLTALSLLSLVFGTFLIYNTITFSVVQRRGTIGTLRALGVGRRVLAGGIVAEGALIGVLGGLLGLALGILLGRGLVRLVTRTINDLYYSVTVSGLRTPASLLLGALALGVAAAALAAAVPALEATRGPARAALQRSTQEEGARRWVARLVAAGAVLALLAWGVVQLLPPTIPWAFVALTLVLLALAAVAPGAVTLVSGAVAGSATQIGGTLAGAAVRSVGRALSRTGPAIAALVVSIAVTVGMGGMISSFRVAVADWLEQTLQADVYLSLPGRGGDALTGALDPGLVDRLRALPELSDLSLYRAVDLSSRYGLVRLVALDLAPAGEAAFRFEQGRADLALPAFREDGAALISEPFRYRNGLEVGDTIQLATPSGLRGFPVAGVFTDYGTERGTVMISRDAYLGAWSDSTVSSLGLFAASGVDERSLLEAARLAAGDQPVVLQSTGALRAQSLVVFDRTFAVTGALRMLAFLVAFIGIVGALMALEMERVREFGLLRATGVTPGGLRALIVGETTFLGLACGVVAIPAGFLLAALMVRVVNRRSFGWGMDLALDPALAWQALALGVVGAALASLYPAWRISRTSPAVALRAE